MRPSAEASNCWVRFIEDDVRCGVPVHSVGHFDVCDVRMLLGFFLGGFDVVWRPCFLVVGRFGIGGPYVGDGYMTFGLWCNFYCIDANISYL